MIENEITNALPQILVGKKDGEDMYKVATLSLPETFEWVVEFSPEEIATFLEELIVALHEASLSDKWAPVSAVIESWRETAELLADPEHLAAVAEARAQYQTGDIVSADEVLTQYSVADE
jgi:hypothetical protein